ncbi:hypothetical protein MNBD_GAMMA13-1278 [hydrothermal vent metagenome]|uniref:Uncharacterized protein n=1 Tax=hydrothermal vent metagenome TaxID=652676 RepID=A0A3B0ZML9_9ZZZZ
MSTNTRQHIWYGLFGLTMGGTLSLIGFTDFAQVHGMFTFSEFNLLFAFAATVALSMVIFGVFARDSNPVLKKFHKGTIPGGMLFGAGWAITGACPSVALVQLGEGKFLALVTVIGIFAGVWGFRKLAAGAMKLDTGTCGE